MQKQLIVRMNEDDLALLKEAAWINRLSVSAWVRNVVVVTAKDQLGVANDKPK